jgi:hypothetical protein
MTTQMLHLYNAFCLGVLLVVVLLTRATVRRALGALVAGLVFGVVCLCLDALGEAAGLWHFAIDWEPYFLSLALINFALPCAVIYLVTWRINRRFGWRGVGAVVAYAPGIAPVLAVAGTYIVMVFVGQAVMRLVAGPSHESPLARRPWQAAA